MASTTEVHEERLSMCSQKTPRSEVSGIWNLKDVQHMILWQRVEEVNRLSIWSGIE
jgi:hypothetical protein